MQKNHQKNFFLKKSGALTVACLNHFLQWLISQDRNNIFKFFQSLKPSTHYVLLTGAIGTLQCSLLESPESPNCLTFCNC